MQIKVTLIVLSLLIAVSSFVTVSASLPEMVIIEDDINETIITPVDGVDNPELIDTPKITNSPEESTHSLILDETTTTVETPILPLIDSETSTNTSLVTSENILENENSITTNISLDIPEINHLNSINPLDTVLLTEPITATSTVSVDKVTESEIPIKEPEIPSAALASGIFMVIGGLMLPRNP